ncbi:hypothetical protein B0H12DRAFT_1093919 [Mycena haematopus]|nr:hypothetical protein B0H12DRAFT_1093919 [Mycena haematopus]
MYTLKRPHQLGNGYKLIFREAAFPARGPDSVGGYDALERDRSSREGSEAPLVC